MTHAFAIQNHPGIFLRPHITYPYAWVGHIPFMYVLADILRPRKYVELGTDSGNSYLAFCQAVAAAGMDCKCFAVDCWEGDSHARFYGDHVYRTLASYHDPKYGKFSTLVKAYFDEALDLFEDGSIDLLHIDGLHTYEAVSHDFETWLPKMSEAAVVILHDSAVMGRGFGVSQFVGELKERYKVFEFNHSNGLAVVQVGEQMPASFVAFFEEAIGNPNGIRTFFEAAASTLLDPATAAPVASAEAADHSVECILYFRDDGEIFEEGRSSSIVSMGGDDARFEFLLPNSARPQHIRVDPASLPGAFRLRAIELRAGDSSINMFADARSLRFEVNGEILPCALDEGIRFLALHNDPFVEIDLRGVWETLDSPGGETSIVVRLTYEQVLANPTLQALAAEASIVIAQAKESVRRERPEGLAEQITRTSLSRYDTLRAQIDSVAQAQARLAGAVESVLRGAGLAEQDEG